MNGGLLTLEMQHELESNSLLAENLKQKKRLYRDIARHARENYPEFHDIDRVDIVALIIRKTDPDIPAIAEKIKGMSVQEICEIYARSVVGHENDE